MANVALRVLVCAAQPAVRAGLRDLLTRAGFDVTGELSLDALGGSSATAPLESADVLVADIGDPGPDADLLARLRSELADFPVVLLVDGPEAARVDDVSDVGGDDMAPRGWLLREAAEDELAAAVRAVAAGMVVLDPSIARRALAPGLCTHRAPKQGTQITGYRSIFPGFQARWHSVRAMSAPGQKQTFFDCRANVRFRGHSGRNSGCG